MPSHKQFRRWTSGCCLASFLYVCIPAWGGNENAAQVLSRKTPPSRDLGDPDEKALYCVGYAHLDTQWRWDFVKTIDDFIRSTLDDNFALFERYPEYVFNFTGSVRYEMMKEYYPKRYEQLRKYIADGRWFVSGSSVDEGDANVPSPESIIRQVLYGNQFFKREFGKESTDFMLPDCFGFPASMPSIWSHCGLLGFSTQKLTWGSAVGIPFPVGVWEGPDGNGVIAALDPGPYVGAIQGRVDQNVEWIERVKTNGTLHGIWADYHYYGVGDQGGAPREDDVRNYVASQQAADRQMDVVLSSSQQFFHDVTPQLRDRLPRFRGDMLLTEHSAGTLTSQSYMKRWNRQAEQLADAAERAAAAGWWLGQTRYPRQKLERAWVRILANQMHDILPGTSIPRAYRYSWNDDIVGLNQFAHVLTSAVGDVASQLDTQVEGTPLVVFNPLAIDRTDIVEATVPLSNGLAVRVFGPDNKEIPSQILERNRNSCRIIFPGQVPANGFAVFDIRPAASAFDDGKGPRVGERLIENETYRVKLNKVGDVESIHDRRFDRDLLSEPASLVFTHEKPQEYPAWNMDWADRKNPPTGKVDGKPVWRVIEDGPVRGAIAVTRYARNSKFTQIIRLTRGDAGKIVEVAANIDWQSAECALKASFPFKLSNSKARYNWGAGTIERGNNDPTKYEVPSHEWFDLTDKSGDYGVTVLEDSKFGSDKPSDNELRLTLLFTPGVRHSYLDQHSQDWGVHDIRYGLYGHEGDWRSGQSEWRGRRFNQPLRAFVVDKHPGPLGRMFSFVRISSPQVDIRAIKLAEQRDAVIIRMQELWGQKAERVRLTFPTQIKRVDEVDGQERLIQRLEANGRELVFDLDPYQMQSFAIDLSKLATASSKPAAATPITLSFDTDIASRDDDRTDGAMDSENHSYPGELLPEQLIDNNVAFQLGSTMKGESQAVTCRGQQIDLGDVRGNQIHLLAAATEDVQATFHVGKSSHALGIQSWTGFVGQWYDRVWSKAFGETDFRCDGQVVSLLPAFVKRDPIAWFSTHRHHPTIGNEAYRFTYLYHYILPRPDSTTTHLTLPHDERIRVLAISLADDRAVAPAAFLYDDFEAAKPINIRHKYKANRGTIFANIDPVAKVRNQRTFEFEQTPIGPPRSDDDIDSSNGLDFRFLTYSPREDLAVHPGSGTVDGHLARLNDGQVAQNDDDTERCVWYDNEGRFTLDLKAQRRIEWIETFSWHKSDRAPQYFSVWGSTSETMPDVDFEFAKDSNWELIAVADTRQAGDGGIHATRIEGERQPMGPYRHLLWICEDMGHGTFFTEIDIDFADQTP